MKKLLAASLTLAVTLGMANVSFADRGPELDPNFKATVNVDVIDANNETFRDRINTELVERPAPQVGQTRAAIEAMYGPAMPSLAPNKNYEVYTNEFDLTDGRRFQRMLSNDGLRIYEVKFRSGAHKSQNDKAVDVKLRVIPRVGDHMNMISKMMGNPSTSRTRPQGGQQATFSIPKERFVFYNDVITSPFEAVNMYFDADGFLVGQEFMPGRAHGQYVLTSAGRYVEFESKAQLDRKIGW